MKRALLSSAVLLSACDAILGIDAYPGAIFVEAACADCMAEGCREEVEACLDDPTCAEQLDCEGRCAPDDVPCRATCASMRPEPAQHFVEADACRRRSCLSSCIGDELQPPQGGSACAACVDADPRCVEARRACLGDASCEGHTVCLESAGDPHAVRACDEAFPPSPSGSDAAWSSCTAAECGEACGAGVQWACVDEWSGPFVATGDTVPVRLRAVALFENNEPLEGVRVEVCERFEIDETGCVPMAGATATTDADGWVDLALPSTDGAGFEAHLRLSRASVEEEERVAPNLFKVNVPLSSPTTLFAYLLRNLDVADGAAAACHPPVAPAVEGMGGVTVFAFDCALSNARCAEIELLDASGETCEAPTCGYEEGATGTCYLNGSDACTGATTGAGVTNVTPGLRDLGVRVGERRVAHIRDVPVVAGIHTHIQMFPDQQ